MEVTSIRMNLLNNAGGIKAIGSFHWTMRLQFGESE